MMFLLSLFAFLFVRFHGSNAGGHPVLTDSTVEMSALYGKLATYLEMWQYGDQLAEGEFEWGACGVLYDMIQDTVRIKGLLDDEDDPMWVTLTSDESPTTGTPYFRKKPVGYMGRAIAGKYPLPGKAITILTAYNEGGGTPVPTIKLANAGEDLHGRPTPLLKVKMGDPGTGFACVLHHDIGLSTYCNGELVQGSPNAEEGEDSPLYTTDNDITSIVDNNQIKTQSYAGTLIISRSDESANYVIMPIPYGWLVWQTKIEEQAKRRKRLIENPFSEVIASQVYGYNLYGYEYEHEVALGMCSIDANPEIGGGEGTGMTGPDRFRADSIEQLLELYMGDDDMDGDETGAAYARSSAVADADESETEDDDDDLGAGSDAGGHCPLVTAEVERNYKKTCKDNKKVEKMCGIFTSSAGPLKDCLASTAGTPTMFNAAAAYEECRLSICARVPAKKLCHVLKQHVDLCNKQHVAGGKSHPATALWRSVTNCKFDKLKKKGDPNGVVACIDPRERPSCWKPDGCNRLPDIDDSPHECDERMVCNDGYLWNGKKCVKSGSC